jgi:tetratricopeptide (TPR) repeat protein
MTHALVSKTFLIAKRHTLIALVFAALVLWTVFFHAGLQAMREDVVFAIDPSAERAFLYGSRHFDAKDPREYNIDRAEYFFRKVATIDPETPFLFHELARIAFLRGDLRRALAQINIQIHLHGESAPNSYYVRGLIRGYAEDFDGAAGDYAMYLKSDPKNWAAINDYAWVLIKSGRYEEALAKLNEGIADWPQNPWLLNSRATALFELGRIYEAHNDIVLAEKYVADLTEAEWSHAYPGNDPLIAEAGLSAFRAAVFSNTNTITKVIDAQNEWAVRD